MLLNINASEKNVHKTYENFYKVWWDKIIALVALVVLVVPMGVIAIIIKLTSKGPVFFVQKRYGKNSEPFQFIKFRTMIGDTKQVTPVGKILRKTSMDELPQLFNVLKGDMSIVGPRPLADMDYEVINMRQQQRIDSVRPGLTGLAQVNGRNDLSDEAKIEYDKLYIQSISLQNDVHIMLKSVSVVVSLKGINKKDSTTSE